MMPSASGAQCIAEAQQMFGVFFGLRNVSEQLLLEGMFPLSKEPLFLSPEVLF